MSNAGSQEAVYGVLELRMDHGMNENFNLPHIISDCHKL